MIHAEKFETKIIEKSNKPKGIKPEERKLNSEMMEKCLVIFFCVEKNDTVRQADQLCTEIIKTAAEIKTNNIMISPFVHLSNNIAKPEIAKKLYEQLLNKFKSTKFKMKSSHFGYHKSLSLDIKGHPGSFRYREF